MHEMHVLVEKPSGRWQTRCRFLFQLGTDKLKYMEGMTKKTFLPDPIKMVLCCAKRHAETEDWGYVIKEEKDVCTTLGEGDGGSTLGNHGKLSIPPTHKRVERISIFEKSSESKT